MRRFPAAFWFALTLFNLAAIVACDRDEGPLEETREGLEETGEEIQDEVDDAT